MASPTWGHGHDRQLDVVGGAGAHPDELTQRTMTTHPAAVDAGTRSVTGGAVETTKYLTCGHARIGRGSALKGTRSNAGATKTTPVAEIRATRDVAGSLRRWCVEQGCSPFSHVRCPTRASGSRAPRVPILFAMAGP